ncbi:DUF2103 domain-containing protein [Almyronema epifaneia]|uniref:DUF2103 domain-containing protein n=1 Tax=Almyronema epifaneia S1 TaxID=2991925 RepID=A0ABW6IAJ3_9CYAN
MGKSSEGRLVWNHSTHIPKLIPVLEKLLASGNIRTITPGEIKTTRSHVPKLQIKVSVPIRGGYKLIARKAKAVQEVFVLTTLDQISLEAAIAQVLDASRP